MLEGSVMTIAKMYISLFIVVCLVSITSFFVAVGQANEFKEYVDHEIEAHGGLTAGAMAKISDYNVKYFHGEFKISSAEMGRRKNYGEEVIYELNRPYKFLFLELGGDIIHAKGKSISHVR